jgi:hypothetical protein
MKLYYVHALDADGCEIYTDSKLTKKEAVARAVDFQADSEIKESLARIKIFEERTNICVAEWRVVV